MNSCNCTFKGSGRLTIDRPPGLCRKNASGFPIATRKKKLWLGIEEVAGCLETDRRAANRFRRQKKLANKDTAAQRKDRGQAEPGDAESDVLKAGCEGSLDFATASGTEFRRAAARCGTNSRHRRSVTQGGGGVDASEAGRIVRSELALRKFLPNSGAHEL